MSAVSRSVYQKVCEENKRLKDDILKLIKGSFQDKIEVRSRWGKEFKREESIEYLLRQQVDRFIEANPDDPAVVAYHEIKNAAK